MKLPFVKMHGLGNDYVYVDCVRPEKDPSVFLLFHRKKSVKKH